MAKTLLVRPSIEAAKVLIGLLVKDGLPIRAAFLHRGGPGAHDRIVLVTPLADEQGSLPVYRRVRSVLDQHPDIRLTLSEMSIVGERDAVYQELLHLPTVMPLPHDVVFARPNFSPYVPYVSEDEDKVTIHLFYMPPTENGEHGSTHEIKEPSALAPPEQAEH